MPFAAPEYDQAFAEFLYTVVNDLARARSRMLSMIPQETSRSTVASRIRARDGLDVDMPEQPVQFELTFDADEIRAGDPMALVLELDRASDGTLWHSVSRQGSSRPSVCEVRTVPSARVWRTLSALPAWSGDRTTR